MPYIVYHLASLAAIKSASHNHTQEDASDPEPRLILRYELHASSLYGNGKISAYGRYGITIGYTYNGS